MRNFAGAISRYQEALALTAEAIGPAAVTQIRLRRKMIEVVTEAKWSVDKETYNQVLQIREDTLAGLTRSLTTLAEEPPNAETVHLLARFPLMLGAIRILPSGRPLSALRKTRVDMAEHSTTRWSFPGHWGRWQMFWMDGACPRASGSSTPTL